MILNLDSGAVENWLVRMLAHARTRSIPVDWTFYCVLGREGVLDDRVKSLGGKVVYSSVPLDQKGIFLHNLRSELRHGRYGVLHCHHDLVSGAYLTASAGLPLNHRIVHVHNADEAVLTPNRLKQAIYHPLLRRICLSMSDRIVGISNHTLDSFLAGRKRRPGRDLVLYYGVDPNQFNSHESDRAEFRSSIGLPRDALILLFGGRIVPEKNPVFAVDVIAALRRFEPRAAAVFAGAGSLEGAVVARAKELGVEDNVRVLGWRRDLPNVMQSSDWFILPRPEHPMEGFGLAVVEAQLAGLRLLLSLGVADDPLLPGASCRRLSLSQGPEEWAAAAISLMEGPQMSKDAARRSLNASAMDMDRALDNLLALYN